MSGTSIIAQIFVPLTGPMTNGGNKNQKYMILTLCIKYIFLVCRLVHR